MPLDSNLFILLVRPRQGHPGWIDFVVDRSSAGGDDELAYSAHKDPRTSLISLFDPLSSSLLGTHALAPPSVPNAAPTAKSRLVRLEEPLVEVPLRAKTGLSWCWEMEWEGTRYAWERDVVNPFGSERGFTLVAVRKPDPDYPVSSFHPKKKGGSVEMYDYNLQRVEPPIKDKKGLEIATLLALSFFIEHLFGLPESSTSSSPAAGAASPAPAAPLPPVLPLPPKPIKPPADRRQSSLKGLEVNEVEVRDSSQSAQDALCEKCLALFTDPTLLYLVLFTTSAVCVPAVAALAERVKRKRYKASGEEVKLFVDDSGATASGSIGGKGKQQPFAPPPSELRIYLSRIELSELLPNHRPKPPPSPPKPPIRPPIVFDSPAAPTVPPKPSGSGRLSGSGEGEKSTSPTKEEGEGGGWRSWLKGAR
ncbi:hypothetical protein JCM10213_008253 [Rhodosporidiobolus nylandii]